MSDELKPRNRTEQYYEYMATGENAAELTPRHRQEQWFEKIAEGRISDYAELENTPIQPASESEVDGNYYYSEGSITRRINGEDYELATTKDVDDAVTSVYRYKGSVATYSDLPSEDLTIGDVYNVVSDGNNYAWDGSDWDQLGGFKTNYPFPSSWQTSLTTDDFCADVNADGEAIEGMTYLGDVYFTDMPFSGNGDLVVEVIEGTGTSNKVIHLILTSGNVAPYRWEYTYWNNGSSKSGWLSWQLPIDSNNQLSASYIATDSDHLFVTDSEKSTWNGKQDLIDSTHQLAPEYINTDSTARFISDSELNAKQDVIDSLHKLAPEYINTDSTARFISDSELSAKLDTVNPTGTGSLSLNRKANSFIGTNSIALGYNTTATGTGAYAEGEETKSYGSQSHAEGYDTTASCSCDHAEGASTQAYGNQSHAEGMNSIASGQTAHAEGYYTTASGQSSHAEGDHTTANHRSQHVFGAYNILDTNAQSGSKRGDYIEIVGNGTANDARSNARTLDWSGNEYIAGKMTATGFIIPNKDQKQILRANGTSLATYEHCLWGEWSDGISQGGVIAFNLICHTSDDLSNPTNIHDLGEIIMDRGAQGTSDTSYTKFLPVTGYYYNGAARGLIIGIYAYYDPDDPLGYNIIIKGIGAPYQDPANPITLSISLDRDTRHSL